MAAAAANVKANCVTCGKERATSKCSGCSQDFCYKHLGDHRQELSKQLDGIEVTRDVCWQTLSEHKSQLRNHSLIETINRREQDSIEKIRQNAEEARQSVYKHLSQPFAKIEDKLNQLTDQLRRSREEEDFFESDLYGWEKELSQLTERLSKPLSKVELHEDQIPLIAKIGVALICDHQGNE
jgi:chromosome segregation ATPase